MTELSKNSPSNVLLFACSGASDVGEVADRATRTVAKMGAASMACLSAISAREANTLKKAESASRIIAVDGCGFGCAHKNLLNAGFESVEQVKLSELGLVKGKTEVGEKSIAIVSQHLECQLNNNA
ncbi:putative zinc-binding protein [Teredinibacter sp. KSP-S5-2]|uniref:putative zinc-binding protein n=1 Tax=Teredinibacter sp. KSP-S5-2 TaxID=3034506 RepID=UPI00293459C3|nr:putative zinc-binding protein [Teredinibacter sp. KSP-S5-2]WNO10683.1 putative zinc-binding protein [Teredinibacter sp. KSP-S5-2]